MTMRTTRRWLVVTAVAAALVIPLNTQPAGASHDSTCSAGDMCLWGADWYAGCVWTYPNSTDNLGAYTWFNCTPPTASPTNGANSFKNRGTSCTINMYDWNNRTGGYRWASREGLGGWWADGNLGNNYWDGSVSGSSGTILEDDMQSYKFC